MAGKKKHAILTEVMLEAVARRFRTLGVVSRLRILNALMDGPLTVSELIEETGLAQSNLSRQLGELEQEGCVARRRDGRTVEVSISDPDLEALCALVCDGVAKQASAVSAALSGRSRR